MEQEIKKRNESVYLRRKKGGVCVVAQILYQLTSKESWFAEIKNKMRILDIRNIYLTVFRCHEKLKPITKQQLTN